MQENPSIKREKRTCLNREALVEALKLQARVETLKDVNIAEMVDCAANAFELSNAFKRFSFMNRQTKSGVVFRITESTRNQPAFELEAFIVSNPKNHNMKMPQRKVGYGF